MAAPHSLPPLEAETTIAAPIDVVWSLLSDLRAMSERSPETIRMFISDAPKVGSRGINVNRRGWVWWPTTTRITRWKPPSQAGHAALAFWVGPTGVEWSYELTESDGTTHVVERRSSLPEPSRMVKIVAKYLLGGADVHDGELQVGMEQTLAALKAHAEARDTP